MFLILLPMMAAGFLVYRIVAMGDSLMQRKIGVAQRRRVATGILLMAGVALAVLVGYGPASETLTGFPVIESGLVPNTLVARIGLQWLSLVGLGLLFVPMGLYRLFRMEDRRRSFTMVALAIAFLPLMLNPVYGILAATPVVLLVACVGILPSAHGSSGRKPRLFRISGLVSLVAAGAIVVAPILVTVPRSSGVPCGEPNLIDSQTYNTALYMRFTLPPNTSFAWDDHIEAQRLEALSGRPSLEPVESIADLAYPWIANKMVTHFRPDLQIADFLSSGHQLVTADEWLSTTGLFYPYYWGKHTFVLLQNYPDSPTSTQILDFYRVSVAVSRCSGTEGNVFYTGLGSSTYLAYADELQQIYWLKGYS
jgi:hypothetical protein